MGLFDKIKNALFEEEYVEVEEKPKKSKKEVPKKENERPIAKKVILPKKEDVKIEELDDEEYLDEDFEIQPKNEIKESHEAKRDFKVMDEDDFRVDDEYDYRNNEPKIVKVIDKDEPVKEDVHYYQGKKEKSLYGIDESNKVNVPEYGRSSTDTVSYSGVYERKEDRTHFKPSPIISPIYGILDKNYRKEDVVTKREVRLTSSYARENLSVDDVRKKAYGSLSDDIAKELDNDSKKATTFEVEEENVEENLLVDLSDDKEKPAVKEVTMGDALEYFEDLGLEYNVDYVDAAKEKTVGRRSKENYEEKEELTVVQDLEEESNVDTNNDVSIDSDDNLFDLIDSMYKEND
mgnify:CR=1 FL=1